MAFVIIYQSKSNLPQSAKSVLLLFAFRMLLAGLLGITAIPGCGDNGTSKQKRLDGHAKMLVLLQDIREHVADEHYYIGDAELRHAKSVLATLPNDGLVFQRFQYQWKIAYDQAKLGKLEEAISTFESAYQLFPQIKAQLEAGQRELFLLHMATTCLRLGEAQNCLHCQTGESCILPLQGAGIHERRGGMQQAIKHLTTLLNENTNHLSARWLLNIAEMALGNYPQGVPEHFRVAPEKFRSQSNFPRFNNVARQLGIDAINLCGGTVIDDFDNDGYLDILTSTWDPSGQIILFRNLGNGKFERRTRKAGLEGLFGGLNLIQADYDNDGDVDVLVLRGAWLGEGGRHPNSLLQNDGTGRFRDVTFEVGLGDVHYPTQTAAWADFDNDGDLDLYIGNEQWPNQLFKNDGNGHFIDVAAQAGVQNNRFSKGVIWGDYDNDRLPDLYVSNYKEENRLYHNNGDGTFTDVAPKLGVTSPIESFPVWFWDYNNDGVLDLYVASWWPDVKYVAAEFFDIPHEAEFNCLYEGDGQGGFQELASQRNLNRVSQPMGANFGDLDNDGWLDMYLGTGYPEYEALMPNLMFRNRNGTSFEDVTMSGGFGHLQKGHGVAFADLDNDGDQDVYIQMGGAFAGDQFNNVLFENPGFHHHWIGIKLVGRESNRSAIGARIRVDVIENGQTRSIFKWVNSGGSFGANPLQQQIGLGNAKKIQRVEIFWPKTGRVQTLSQLDVDQFVEIIEGIDGMRQRPLKRFQFPKPPDRNTLIEVQRNRSN